MGPLRALLRRIALRLQRRWLQGRALVKRRDLSVVRNAVADAPEGPILLSTVRNEAVRLPHFLEHYRKLGIVHFLIVDNGSTDGTAEILAAQPDVSCWHTTASYKAARFGVDWLNGLLARYGAGRWILVADPDELLVYPHHDTRKLPALTRWLEDQGEEGLPVMLLDMYGRHSVAETRLRPGEDPIEVAPWFDAANYTVSRDPRYRNLWIQGGPRMRVFFAFQPRWSPALNKIPLVRWRRGFVFKTGAHDLLPRRLNVTYAKNGGAKTSGVMLHPKFLDMLAEKADEERSRREHYADGREYTSYAEHGRDLCLWSRHSTRYHDWRQLCDLGLMARGGWF